MVYATISQSSANNGNASPATPGSITAVQGRLLVLIITAVGTNPLIGTPGGWTVIQNVNGSSVSTSGFCLPNNAGGATNPSSTLTGTITGWVATLFEFPLTGANCQLQGSAQDSQTSTIVREVFASQIAQMPPQQLFIYAIGRATNVFTPNLTGLGPSNTSGWSTSQLPQVGVQGISQDFYFGSNEAIDFGPWPKAQGTLASSAVYKALGAWFNMVFTDPQFGDNVSGNAGIYVPSQYQGMIGG